MSERLRIGAQTLLVGAAPDCEVRLEGPGVLPIEAELIRHDTGQILLVPSSGSDWTMDGRPLSALTPTPLEPGAEYRCHGIRFDPGDAPVARMLLTRGGLPYTFGELTLGRDPSRCHLVLANPGVSACHATFQFPPIEDAPILVTDLESTGGTWLAGERLTPHQPAPARDDQRIALGPVLVPVKLLRDLHDQSLLGQEPTRTTTQVPHAPGSRERRASRRHHTVLGTVQLTQARSYRIGRIPDNDIVLDYPQISAHHARLVATGERLWLEDAGGELGTMVKGQRLRPSDRVAVSHGETIQFGPLLTRLEVRGGSVSLSVLDDEGWIGRPLLEVEADGITVRVPDRTRPTSDKTLLDQVTFKALPGDLIALMGPSGSGKTTLLHALSGYLTPSAGQVRVNGRPLSEVFDSLRGSIGYVPQDDIIHPELTVREAVTYSACLRLPSDFTDQEIKARVDRTLSELGLEEVAHLQIGKPEAKVLSGGQRKRVNIAIELVTDPILLLLDEPTSGLAADDTAHLIALLDRLAQSAGKTIIATIHQPARREYERFNLALILGPGGIPLYFGPSQAAYGFFESWRPDGKRQHVDNPRDMFAEITARGAALSDSDSVRARETASLLFRKDYESSDIAREMSQGRRALGAPSEARFSSRRKARPKKELSLLLSRCLTIKLRDRVSTAILLLQAPLIALLLGFVFGRQRAAPPAWCYGALSEIISRNGQRIQTLAESLPDLAPTRDRAPALFFLVVSAIWFGTSNAAREVVAERAIFRRESMVHLSALNYIASKFVVLSGLCLIQCTTLLGISWLMLQLSGGARAFGIELGMLVLTSLSSVALGLLISALVRTTEAAMALTPLALIPQVVLGGLMVPVTTVPWLELPMLLVPARWGFEGVIRPERLAERDSPAWNIALDPTTPASLPDFIDQGWFRCGIAQLESTQLLGALGFGSGGPAILPAAALLMMTLTFLVGVVTLLKRSTLGRAPR